MESPEEFRQQFSFLEGEFALPCRSFTYSSEFFGNIVAEYGAPNCYIKVVRDRGLTETWVSRDRSRWRPLDAILKELGLPESVQALYRDDQDYFGGFSGNTASGQASAIRAHLVKVKEHLVGA
jgi:hypothetical protein